MKNTQNITDQIINLKIKNEETISNNFSFRENTKKKKMDDSVDKNLELIKEKND